MNVGFQIVVPVPEGETPQSMKRYVLEALRMWRKGGDPNSPLFHASDRAFKVVNGPYQ